MVDRYIADAECWLNEATATVRAIRDGRLDCRSVETSELRGQVIEALVAVCELHRAVAGDVPGYTSKRVLRSRTSSVEDQDFRLS